MAVRVDPLPSAGTRILRRRQVEALTGWARSTIYQGMAEGRFPKPIHLGPRSVGWLASEIEGWVQARIAESRPATGEVRR
ncbi:MAG: AlpA family transcriptional regulator [Polyangia bacterium]|jgi:prophage regulatory protein